MSRKPSRPKLFFSFRSPYSWLTIRRLRQRVPNAFEIFDWFPYWDPDEQTSAGLAERGAEFHYVQMSRAKHLYLLMDTKRLTQAEGVSMAWPIDVAPHWELPHLAWLAAREVGLAEQFYDEVAAARWERGADICTPSVVADCAERAGLDPGCALSAPFDAQVRAEGVGCLERAYLDDVFGIPYVKWGMQRYWGLDRLDAFLAAWQPTTEPPAMAFAVPALTTSYDLDTTGGCG
jgi:2-hydroxychromene-2-carboxylate isomerase